MAGFTRAEVEHWRVREARLARLKRQNAAQPEHSAPRRTNAHIRAEIRLRWRVCAPEITRLKFS
jgi:hypothetical protein